MRKSIWLFIVVLCLGCDPEDSTHDANHSGINFSAENTVLTEAGNEGQAFLSLKTQPSSDLILHITSSDTTEIDNLGEFTITKDTWSIPRILSLNCIDDGIRDGNQSVTITIRTETTDMFYAGIDPASIQITCIDDGLVNSNNPITPNPDNPNPNNPNPDNPNPDNPNPDDGNQTQTIRFMAANITSGNQQTYDDGKGIRIFEAFKPDIVVIQEFNYTDGAHTLVNTVFGEDFHYYKGTGRIPNGIISRWPILSSGTWNSNITSDRAWEWAVVDIPGDRDLLAVSVHLHGKDHNKEFQPLLTQINNKQKEGNYYVILGGDFNTEKRDSAVSLLCNKSSILTCSAKSGMYPVDQLENGMTSGERDDYYDYVIFDKDLDSYEIPITIGSHTYAHGHVIDSRVYSDLNELDDIPPVEAEDSWLCETSPHCDGNKETRTNMQHMAVIRDVKYKY